MEEFPDGGKNNNVDLAPAQTADEIDGCGWADKQSDRLDLVSRPQDPSSQLGEFCVALSFLISIKSVGRSPLSPNLEQRS